MNTNIKNWSSPAYQEFHKIINDEIALIVNQVDTRVKIFENNFVNEAAKFVRDFKYLVKEADESLDKITVLENENDRLLRAVCEEYKYDKISYDKAYNNMQQKMKWLQAQLGDLKDKIKDTPCVSDTLDPLSQKLEDENVENTKFENHTTVGKPFLQPLRNYYVVRQPNALKSERLKWVPPKVAESNDLLKQVTLNSAPSTRESKVVNNDKVIAPGMLWINPFKTFREEKYVPNKPVKASVRIKPITTSQPHFISQENVNSNSNGISSIRVESTARTKSLWLRSNTKNDRVPSTPKSSCVKNKEVEVEEHHRNLLLYMNKKHMSSECNNTKLAIRNDKSEVVCAMCMKCLITTNHDVCVLNYVNDMNSRDDNQSADVLNVANQKKHKQNIKKSKTLGSKERLASPKPRKPRTCLRWSPTGRMFDFSGKLIESSDYECESNSSKDLFMEMSALVNYHVVAILGYGDLQWETILITRVYFVEGLGHNLFSDGQFYDSDLEVAFRRNTCFVKNLEGVDLLKANRTTNLYTINLHEMAFASPICLLARATSTKSWLWHQRLSHLNFDTINDLAKMISSPVFQNSNIIKNIFVPHMSKEKSEKASRPPKHVPNLKHRLHLLHMDVCGQMRVEIINGKRYRLVIVDDYFRYTWVHFLRSKDEAPKVIKTFLKKIQVLLQAPVIINDHEDIGKLGAKGDIGFFIGYSANSCAYRIYNRRTKKIMEMMNVTFDELSAMAFEQCSSKPGLQSMTSGQISSGLAMYDDYIGGQPSAAPRTTPAIQNLHTPNASRTVEDSASTPTNSSSQAADIPNTS
ncbi:retrovirus-related pol polyprotein from transposon TNT 1-94 [Tanacetum coccineum]